MERQPKPRFRPIEEAEKPKIETLERESDWIYAERTQLVSFYKQYRDLLPLAAGKEHARMTLADLQKLQEEAESPYAFRETLASMIPKSALLAKAKRMEARKEDIALIMEMDREDAVEAIIEALYLFEDLVESGKSWNEKSIQKDEKEAREFYRMRFGEFAEAIEKRKELLAEVETIQRKLDIVRSGPGRSNRRSLDLLLYQLDAVRERYNALQETPEGYLAIFGAEMTELKEAFDAGGTMVETPYVKSKIDRIKELLWQGRPVFIHGELGSGKTELARHIARITLSKDHLARFDAENPAPKNRESEEYRDWREEREKQKEAIVYSGHKASDVSEVVAARGIRAGKKLSAEAQMMEVKRRWSDYKNRLLAEAALGGEKAADFEKKLEEVDRPLFERALERELANPIETKVMLGPILLAMEEGRPFILDEMNAIPHHTLIAINDLLLRKPGDIVTPPFPEAKPFEVQKGFSVIATGNYKPEDGLHYIGRQPLDAAFLSRFGIVSYDYLPVPQTTEAADLPLEEERKARRGNELMQMLLVRLMEKDFSIEIPENGIDQLRDLTHAARIIQDIFSERSPGVQFMNERGNTTDKPEKILRENVLSLRHLIPIIEQWKADGFHRPLDEYIFVDYLSRSDARPLEKFNLYRLFQMNNFFPVSEGWPEATIDNMREIVDFNVAERRYGKKYGEIATSLPVEVPVTERYSPKQMIELLFGRVPERTKLSLAYEEKMREMEEDEPEESEAEKLERERLFHDMAEALDRLRKSDIDL